MKLGDALVAVGNQRGKLFAREVGWQKMSSDCTGYGQFVLGVESDKIYTWF